MLEEYLSDKLSELEELINECKRTLERLSFEKNDISDSIEELNSKLDPQMEVLSPLRVNRNIKDNIRELEEKNIELSEEMKKQAGKMKDYAAERIQIVELLNDYRNEKRDMERYKKANVSASVKTGLESIREADKWLLEFRNYDNEVADEIHACNIKAMNALSNVIADLI